MTGRQRVLLCWEAGANRGHLLTLARAARALAGQASIHARLCRMEHAAILAPHCTEIARGWPLKMDRPTPESAAVAAQYKLTWAMWLRARGYADSDFLRAAFDWWRDTIWSVRPSLVVADYAPTALMAARALGIPGAAVGTAYGLPPWDMDRFPVIGRLEAERDLDQDDFCARINEALVPSGLTPLERLPQVYQSTLAFPAGLSPCDPYAAWRRQPLLLPFDTLPELSDGTGDVLFAYLPPQQVRNRTILATLQQLDLPTLLVSPLLDDATHAQLCRNPHLEVRRTPLPQPEIVRRARMILCAGQGGTTALSVLAAIPYLALPYDHEKENNALGAARLPSCRIIAKAERSPERILATLHEMWSDPTLHDAARASAQVIRAGHESRDSETFRRSLSACLRPAVTAGLRGV